MNPQVWIGIVTVVAIVLGPVLALHVQRKLDEGREVWSRKLGIFRTLMSFRATRLAPAFVQALNLIDIEFTDAPEKPVRDSWKELQNHYSDWGRKAPEQRKADDKKDVDRAEELLAELLVKMGAALS
jgi:hypothetical protein